MLLHIDMDAFFASVEQQTNPALREKPVIVGSRNKKYNTIVAAASYEARAYGVESGMSSYKAFKICPHAEFVACDHAKYTRVSQAIFDLLQEFSPRVEHTTIDEYDLEISGLEPHFGPNLELGRTIKKRIREAFGLNCSIGIAPTWILAKLGTKISKPDGLILINETNLDRLISGLPVGKICGIGPALTAHLAVLGITACDQLKTIPQDILINNFGQSTGHWLYYILRMEKDVCRKPFAISPEPKSIGHSHTLSKETTKKEIIFSWLRMLSEMVAERARKDQIVGHTISLWISSKNETFLRQKTYRLPTNDGWEIFMRSRGILSQKKAKFLAVRALGVSLSGLIFDDTPPLLIEQKKREALLNSIDRINAKHGDWTLSPAALSQIIKE